jgi:hypothetical protein
MHFSESHVIEQQSPPTQHVPGVRTRVADRPYGACDGEGTRPVSDTSLHKIPGQPPYTAGGPAAAVV